MTKKEQKKLLTEIMDADAKDGLYHNGDTKKIVTAVEWLIEQINGYAYPLSYNENIRIDIPKEVIEQAKAMEKEQIVKCWDKAYVVGGANGSNDWVNECELTDNGEYYYNETYSK